MAASDPSDPQANDVPAGAEADGRARSEASAETKPKIVTPKARTSTRRKATDGANAGTATGATAAKPKATRSPARPDSGASVASPTVRAVVAAEPPRPVSGETLTLVQTGAGSVTATNVDLRQGGIGRARATDIAVSQGGVGAARADRVSVELGGIGAAMAGELSITQGAAGSILARDARIEQSVVRTLVANNVHVERATGVVFLIARRVDGNVRTLLDWRGALAFGAAFGVVAGLFRRGRTPRP